MKQLIMFFYLLISSSLFAFEVKLAPTDVDAELAKINAHKYSILYYSILKKHYQLSYGKLHTESFCNANSYPDINIEKVNQKTANFNDEYHHFTLGLKRNFIQQSYDHYYEVTNPEISKWIHNENVIFAKAIGCSPEHKKIWNDLLRLRSEKKYVYDVALDKNGTLGFSSYKFNEDGVIIHDRYEGLRKVDLGYRPLYSEKISPEKGSHYPDIEKFFDESIAKGTERNVERLGFSDFYLEQKIGEQFSIGSVFGNGDIGNTKKVVDQSYVCEARFCRLNGNDKGHFFVGQELGVGNYGIYHIDYATKKKRYLLPLTVSMLGIPYINVISDDEIEIYMMEYGALFHHKIIKGEVVSKVSSDLRGFTIREVIWNNQGEPILSAYANSKSYLIKGQKKAEGFDFEAYDLPIISSFASMKIDRKTNEVTISGFSESGVNALYRVNSETMKFEQLFNHDHVEGIVTELHFATSADGHKVPMLVHRDKETKLGQSPVLVYAYGGFSISASDVQNIGNMHYNLLKLGYVVVVPALRGGPENGEINRLNGLYQRRENTYNDLDAVSLHVIDQKWTEKGKVLLHGRSNGGLLVLRGVLGNPELYGAVFSGVPVTDLLDFTNMDSSGNYWAAADYGNPLQDKNIYDFWMNNGPLQMSETRKMKLPPIFIETALGDANVNPAHSFKMIESLRKNQEGGPFLLMVGDQTRKHYYSNEQQNFEIQSYMINFFEKALNDGF